MALLDPIAELMESLACYGAPDRDWVARWGAGNRDPLANAWARSHDLIAMAQLVDLLQQGVLLGADPHDFVRAAASLPDPWSYSDCDALRAALSAPPTLAQVMHARESLPPSALDVSQSRWRVSTAPPARQYAAG